MKKILFAFVTIFTLGLVSCGGSTEGTTGVNDSDSVAAVDSCDTLCADSVVADTLAK